MATGGKRVLIILCTTQHTGSWARTMFQCSALDIQQQSNAAGPSLGPRPGGAPTGAQRASAASIYVLGRRPVWHRGPCGRALLLLSSMVEPSGTLVHVSQWPYGRSAGSLVCAQGARCRLMHMAAALVCKAVTALAYSVTYTRHHGGRRNKNCKWQATSAHENWLVTGLSCRGKSTRTQGITPPKFHWSAFLLVNLRPCATTGERCQIVSACGSARLRLRNQQ